MKEVAITSVANAEHYQWGNNCDGWHLLKSNELSVIQEQMPLGTSEHLHYHIIAQQLFYILSGTSSFIIEEKEYEVNSNESIFIPSGIKHQIKNTKNLPLTFLVISQPKAHGDRINL